MIEKIPLKDVKKGEFIRRKLDSHITYTRAEYDRTFKKYCIDDYSDISRQIMLKGSTLVWVGFDF